MGRTLNRLTTVQVNKLKNPGMHADGGGLYLRISPTGTRSWIFRFTQAGRLRDMGLGSASQNHVSLAAARRRAAECREQRARGIDPISHHRASVAQQQASDAKSLTFRDAAQRYIESHEAAWGRKNHHAWTVTLRDYAHPVLGDLPVRMIDTPLVMQVLGPLWKTRTETATRLRGRIECVLDWAKVSGFRDGENPARWRGHLDHLLPRRTAVRAVDHYAALPYRDVVGFMAKLRQQTSVGGRCLEFTILTAVRLGEARLATWVEIDFDAKTWTIPAPRMKTRKEHRVPLSRRAVELLKEMWAIRRGEAIFYGMRDGPVAGITVLSLAKQVAGAPITVHGFRSSFRDWAAEQTTFPREVAEMALAHAVGDAVERAYQRSDLFERRRKLMEGWAAYCGRPGEAGSKVVPIGRRRNERGAE
jgi:integrase